MTSTYFHNDEVNKIMDIFYKKVKHPYLQKYLDTPNVDEDQVMLLYLMLKDKDLDITYINHCILTTILVQSALDTHEQVSIKNLSKDSMKKKRQLTVLAGDYYSSLYYYFLSKANDVSLMQVLAKSIQEINESKMNVYVKKKQPSNYLNDIRIIDSSLLLNIANLFQLKEWKLIIDEFFFLKRLLKERFMWIHAGVKGYITEFIVNDIVREDSTVEHDKIVNQFDLYIETTKEKLISLSQEWAPIGTFFQKRITDLIKENQYDEQWVMKEG
ncbi:heptaprenyl diphosphate synthase component 1 [Evansella sp. AB-rgal1]|uniref:heptaprenyl diphosphate synthase component 1 n=1 Tax=Evansella sp. AB-rgal1 TaxID=3242696 RepID=UPI00359D338F